jgi:hypothetical protein
MILARVRHIRRLSAIAALVCMSVAVLGARDASAAGERRIHQQVVATGEMMTVARSAAVDVARPLGSPDRGTVGFFLAPHDGFAVTAGDTCHRVTPPASTETLAASRPRRLVFRYEANAPPTRR